jgi:hypothetical protein
MQNLFWLVIIERRIRLEGSLNLDTETKNHEEACCRIWLRHRLDYRAPFLRTDL